jgi:23S rRNA pseudouridine2605 synthase
METIKLQKYFTDCGVLSRRAAEEQIRQGLVRVNGEIATEGMRIDPSSDIVEYRGKRIVQRSNPKTYILLNKPRGYITTLSDDRGRHTVAELVADVGKRVYPVGRLDMDSDGLLLLTDDGELANRLTHPRHEIPKIYHVTITGNIPEEKLKALRSPMRIDGYDILPVQTDIVSQNEKSTVLQMRLFEGRNRQIRKMCALQDLKITRLCRVAIGNITLGNLPQGKWIYLTENELKELF